MAHNLNRLIDIKKVDTKEFEFPETLFVQDIDAKIFQDIVLQCICKIDGVALTDSSFIGNIFGGRSPEVGCGIHTEQDDRNHSVSIKIEVNIEYGVPIPEKSEEIQSKVVEEITSLTGLRVSSVHLIFKNVVASIEDIKSSSMRYSPASQAVSAEEYSEIF